MKIYLTSNDHRAVDMAAQRVALASKDAGQYGLGRFERPRPVGGLHSRQLNITKPNKHVIAAFHQCQLPAGVEVHIITDQKGQ